MRSIAGMTYPELRHLEVEGANDVYPQDVEAEANEWFQKVYHEQLNIDEFVVMLKGWQVRHAIYLETALTEQLFCQSCMRVNRLRSCMLTCLC